jgi:hypothetical protein
VKTSLALVLSSVLLVTCALGAPPPRVRWTDGHLDVAADDTPLSLILEMLARETGLEVEGAANLAETVSVRFTGLSLREGIERVMVHRSYVLVEDTASGHAPSPVLLRVLGGEAAPDAATSAVPGELRDPVAERVAASLIDPEAPMRRLAVRRLAEGGDGQSLTGLVESLADPDPGVREEALAALGQYGRAAIEPVKAMLKVERDAGPRAAALQLLGQVGRDEAAEVLRGALADGDPHVRIAAVEALGYATGTVGREALAAGTRDQEPSVRMAALRTLAVYHRDDSAKAVLTASLTDRDGVVRELAASLLEHLGGASGR